MGFLRNRQKRYKFVSRVRAPDFLGSVTPFLSAPVLAGDLLSWLPWLRRQACDFAHDDAPLWLQLLAFLYLRALVIRIAGKIDKRHRGRNCQTSVSSLKTLVFTIATVKWPAAMSGSSLLWHRVT
jgi:hypothetical protein